MLPQTHILSYYATIWNGDVQNLFTQIISIYLVCSLFHCCFLILFMVPKTHMYLLYLVLFTFGTFSSLWSILITCHMFSVGETPTWEFFDSGSCYRLLAGLIDIVIFVQMCLWYSTCANLATCWQDSLYCFHWWVGSVPHGLARQQWCHCWIFNLPCHLHGILGFWNSIFVCFSYGIFFCIYLIFSSVTSRSFF